MINKLKYIILLACLQLFAQQGYSQQTLNIKGVIKSSEGSPLSNATVILSFKGNKDSLKVLSTEQGNFIFSSVKPGKIDITVSYIGYANMTNSFDFTNSSGEKSAGEIIMAPSGNMLKNITLESQKIQIKEDTVSYVIDSSMYRKNDNVEELLKKLPGVQVDKSGTVTAQGKQVTRVKVNGKEFFGGDVTTATRELNADMVDKIQIIDDYGDQAAFTGIKDGDPSKTMNIQLRKDKNKGYFGNLTAGAGTEDRYMGSVSINKFNNTQQLSLLTNINNTNASLFNFGSMGGAMGSVISSMARGMGIGRGGGGVASAIGNLGNSDGISTTKSAGFNYRDEWSSKVSVYGSYSYSQRGTSTIKNTNRQTIFSGLSNIYIQHSDNYSLADNHRFSFNIEYKIDSMNYIKFNPSVTYTKSTSETAADFLQEESGGMKMNDGITNDRTFSKTPNLNGNLLYNHRFKKKGRTLSINLSAGKSETDGNDDYENLTTIYPNGSNPVDFILNQNIIQDNNNHNYGIRASYTEPLSKKRNLEFNYSHNNQFTGNDRETFVSDPVTGIKTYVDSLSNIYDNVYITNRFGLNLRTTAKKYNYTIGFAVQPATIESNTFTGLKAKFTQHLVNYYPVIRFAYNFSKSRSLNINYNGNTSQPSYSQLQPVKDNSNPQFVTIGNPNLRPEFTNTFSMRYNNFNLISGDVFFGNISASFTNDKIVNNTKQTRRGQETSYLNSNGFYTVLGFYNISKPIQNRKFVFNLGGNVTYNNNISFVTDSQNVAKKNIGRNWIFGQRFATDIKIKKWLETTLSANYSLNSSRYSLQKELNANSVGWTLSNSSRFFLPHSFILSYEIDKTINSGFADNISTDPLIINATLEKQLLKKKNASIKFQAFDLLNENIGISRSVLSTGFEDTRSNRLQRYFLLSFVIRLNKFSGQQQDMQMGIPGGGERRMMRPPGM